MGRTIFGLLIVALIALFPLACGEKTSSTPPAGEEAITAPAGSEMKMEGSEMKMEGSEAKPMVEEAAEEMEDLEAEAVMEEAAEEMEDLEAEAVEGSESR